MSSRACLANGGSSPSRADPPRSPAACSEAAGIELLKNLSEERL
jgi:hypothetical protein